MSLTVSHHIVADVQVDQIALRPMLGAFELLISVTGKSAMHDAGSEPWWYMAANARVEVKAAQGSNHLLGTALLAQPCRFEQSRRPLNIAMEFKLTLLPLQLAAIEDLRAGGDLWFLTTVVGEGGGYNQNPKTIYPTNDSLWKTVARSDWIRALRDAKAMDVLLLEIPMPFIDPPDEIKLALDNLRRAQTLLFEGHYPDCIINCRKSIDTLAKIQKRSRNWSTDALKRLAADRESMTKDERALAAEASLYHFCSLGAHDGGVDILRRDAQFAIVLTATLLARELGVSGC